MLELQNNNSVSTTPVNRFPVAGYTNRFRRVKKMPEEVKIDTDNQIIVVKSYGHISASDVASTRDRIFEIHDETGIDKVLIDAREQLSFLQTLDTYNFSEGVGKDSRSRELKYAIIPSVKTIKDLHFLETVTVNRRITVMIHDNKESAVNSLKG